MGKFADHMGKELGIPASLYMQKSSQLRSQHQQIVDCDQVWLSDEVLANDDMLDPEVTDLFNTKVLGYEKDYTDVQEDVTKESSKKEKPGNSQNHEVPGVVTPLDFSKIKFSEIFKADREHYFMDQSIFPNVDCSTCLLIADYTKVCPH